MCASVCTVIASCPYETAFLDSDKATTIYNDRQVLLDGYGYSYGYGYDDYDYPLLLRCLLIVTYAGYHCTVQV
jgi:hypothetical protein